MSACVCVIYIKILHFKFILSFFCHGKQNYSRCLLLFTNVFKIQSFRKKIKRSIFSWNNKYRIKRDPNFILYKFKNFPCNSRSRISCMFENKANTNVIVTSYYFEKRDFFLLIYKLVLNYFIVLLLLRTNFLSIMYIIMIKIIRPK